MKLTNEYGDIRVTIDPDGIMSAVGAAASSAAQSAAAAGQSATDAHADAATASSNAAAAVSAASEAAADAAQTAADRIATGEDRDETEDARALASAYSQQTVASTATLMGLLENSDAIWSNGVRGRFPGNTQSNLLPNVGYYNISHVSQPRGALTHRLTSGAVYEATKCINYLDISYPTVLVDKFPAAVWFISKADIEAMGITIAGTSTGGGAPSGGTSRLSMKIGLLNSTLDQHSLSGMDVDFLLTYGPSGDETAADPSYNATENIRFAKVNTSGTNGWGEPVGQPNAPDATFWSDGHTAGVEDDGITTTYWHLGVPVPLTWGTYEFKGVKLVVRGSYTGTPTLPLVLGVINVSVVPATVDLLGPDDDDYYQQFFNVEDLQGIMQIDADSEVGGGVDAVFMGDSHTAGPSTDAAPPALIANWFGWQVINSGISGNSSHNMIVRWSADVDAYQPKRIVIYAGANDIGTTIDSGTPTTTSFIVADASKIGVGGWLLVRGEQTQITNLVGTTVTVSPALNSAPSVGNDILIDTTRCIQHMIDMARKSNIGAVFVVGAHYRNFPDNDGDTPTVQLSATRNMRDFQRSAAESRNVPYIDTYAYFVSLINTGDQTQGDYAGHLEDDPPGNWNAHLNATGAINQLARPIGAALQQYGQGYGLSNATV